MNDTLGGGKPCKDCYAHAGHAAKIRAFCKFEEEFKDDLKTVDDKVDGRVPMKLFYILIVVLIAVCGSIFTIGWANYKQNQLNNKDIAVVQKQLEYVSPVTIP